MSGKEPTLNVVIKDKNEIAKNIYLFELNSTNGSSLPACELGSHIAIETPSGANRWYSICQVSNDLKSYYIGVKREAEGRGGSISLVDDTQIGDMLKISSPECEFEFIEADAYLLIAGGIGITPLYAMWQHLVDIDHPNFKLIYLTRSPEETPFLDELLKSPYRKNVSIHHSSSDGRFDFWDLLEKPTAQYIYCCGPKGLMTEVRDMTGHWPASRLHFEDFKPVEVIRKDDKPFRVRIANTNEIVEVSQSQTMLDALRAHGLRIHSSCESGTCGSCKIAHTSGKIDHRDLVLDENEMKTHLMACVSRAKDDEITIDASNLELII